MGPLLGEQEVRRIREVGAAMEEAAATAPLGKHAVYAALLPELAALLSATRFWSMRIVPSPAEGWDLEYSSYWGPRPREATREFAVYEQLLRAPRRPLIFDAAIPEPTQRNRVMFVNELPQGRAKLRALAERTGAGSALGDQARVLVCEGPRLLGFVGCFRDAPFDERDRAALAALTPALRRAHRLERARRDRAFALGAVEAALEIVRDPAFLVDHRGIIRHANKAGERWMARTSGARGQIARVARGESTTGLRHPLPDRAGAVVVMHVDVPRPSSRLERARRRWDLTPRQVEILGRVIDGQTNKEIAAALRCTEGNVELHVTNILRRASSTNRAELVSSFWQL